MIILTEGIKNAYNIVDKIEEAYKINKKLLIECSDEYRLKSLFELLSHLHNEERKVCWADGEKISEYDFLLSKFKVYYNDYGYAYCSLSVEVKVNDFTGKSIWTLRYNLGSEPFWSFATKATKENHLRYII